jgi:LytR cell envelope-related transcriptional attenuator
MAHSAPPPHPSRRRLEVGVGVALVVAAIVAGALTITALRHPKGHSAGQANASTLNSASANPTPTGSTGTGSSASKSSSTTPASTTGSTSTPSTSKTAPSATTSPTSTGSVTAPAAALPLIVLSNTGSESPADTATGRFRAAGWTVNSVGTFDGAILSTAAYYDPNSDGSLAAAQALQKEFPAIQRVKPRFDGLPSGAVIVVITSDYS